MIIDINDGSSILDDDADMLIIPVNTLGVAGKGLALSAASRWPALFDENSQYQFACKKMKMMKGGDILFLGWGEETMDGTKQQIWGAFTKEDWRKPSKLQWVQGCIERLRLQAGYELAGGVRSMALPALGAGLGGLSWDEVQKSVMSVLSFAHKTEVRFYWPQGLRK